MADYCQVAAPTQLITCWFPFVSAAPLLAWGLPLKLLKPMDLFRRMATNLKPAGTLFMVNHGESEARLAAELAEAVGLRRRWLWVESDALLPRPRKPVATYWQR